MSAIREAAELEVRLERYEGEGVISVIVWQKDDLRWALESKGFAPSDKNVQKLLDEGVGRALSNVLIEYGNEVIATAIMDTDGLEEKRRG